MPRRDHRAISFYISILRKLKSQLDICFEFCLFLPRASYGATRSQKLLTCWGNFCKNYLPISSFSKMSDCVGNLSASRTARHSMLAVSTEIHFQSCFFKNFTIFTNLSDCVGKQIIDFQGCSRSALKFMFSLHFFRGLPKRHQGFGGVGDQGSTGQF